MTQYVNHIDARVARALLGIPRPVPLSYPEMVKSLKVTFVPGTRLTPRLKAFGERLKQAFHDIGVREIPFQSALATGEKLRQGIVPIYLGDPEFDVFASGHVPLKHLYGNQAVGIFDRRCPLSEDSSLQDRLEVIVGVLAGNLVNLCIFVTDSSWVMCTMNGSVVRYTNDQSSLSDDVLHGLVPKLAAKVAPPRTSDITVRFGEFDPSSDAVHAILEDVSASATTWSETGLMDAHTSLDSLNFKSPLHRLIVSSFQDDRSGMSFGFLAWQLPTPYKPAVPIAQARQQISDSVWDREALHDIDGGKYVVMNLLGQEYVIEVPDVSALCTRSGCEKTRLDRDQDIVCLTLSNSKIIMDTPPGMSANDDCKPSYDTLTILSSALGNSLVARVLAHMNHGQEFQDAVKHNGVALSHWHGYLSENEIPPGYIRHGTDNPGVCCSTSQSAIYALGGKLHALELALKCGDEYRGDVHIEPHHGTNMVGVMSLHETSKWVQRVTAERMHFSP